MQTVRQPAVAGMFYPANELKLQESVNLLLDTAIPENSFNKIHSLISPHAGYVYSGLTAAYAYNTLQNKSFDTVIIISPSHREYFPGISIYSGDAYKTPLGLVPVNQELREQMVDKTKSVFKGVEGHRQEHAIEVQLPFLQSVLKDFSIIPIVIGDQREAFVDELAEILAEFDSENILNVISSDLSHYHPLDEAKVLDSLVEKSIIDIDYKGLQRNLEMNNCEACGGGGIVSALKAASMTGGKKTSVLHRSYSSDVSGDKSEVVGYLSAVIYE